MTNSIPSYMLKIERAKRHINELAEVITAYFGREPYTLFTDDDHEAGKRFWKVRINEDVNPEWSAILGDAIHNMRSSLDLLMVAVVRLCDPTRVSYNHVKFVVGDSREAFETRLPGCIKGASPEARMLIENLKPYKGGDEAFWRLHQLDILDKHKAIIPVGSAYQSVGVTLDMQRQFPDAFPGMERAPPVTIFLKPQNRQFPLQDGAALFAATLGPGFPLDKDLQFTLDVAFGEGQILDGEPVIPALTQMVQFVEGVIDVIETGLPGLKP